MKKIIRSSIVIAIAILLVFPLCSCRGKIDGDLWSTATYKEDTSLGEGGKTAVVEVAAGDRKVTFTVRTDSEKLGKALLDIGLIDGENGQFGLYIKKVNGITADFDVDQSYWALFIDGETAMTGADSIDITEGTVYRFEYTK